jgi:hypothetical protein
MKVRMDLGFVTDSNGGDFLSFLFGKYVKFAPWLFVKNNKVSNWKEKSHLKQMAMALNSDYIAVSDKKGNILYKNTTGAKAPHQTIAIEQDIADFFPSNNDMEKMIDSPDFVSAYLVYAEYEFIQSSVSESTWRHENFPSEILNSIKNTPYKLGVFDDRNYDVRFNPGRSVLISYTWLKVGWKMWFGKEFFKLVPKEKLLGFPHATAIEELSNGIVYVQLYDKIEEPYTPDNVFRQWKWREWIGYDELEEKYSD